MIYFMPMTFATRSCQPNHQQKPLPRLIHLLHLQLFDHCQLHPHLHLHHHVRTHHFDSELKSRTALKSQEIVVGLPTNQPTYAVLGRGFHQYAL